MFSFILNYVVFLQYNDPLFSLYRPMAISASVKKNATNEDRSDSASSSECDVGSTQPATLLPHSAIHFGRPGASSRGFRGSFQPGSSPGTGGSAIQASDSGSNPLPGPTAKHYRHFSALSPSPAGVYKLGVSSICEQQWFNPERRSIYSGTSSIQPIGPRGNFERFQSRTDSNLGFSAQMHHPSPAQIWPGNNTDSSARRDHQKSKSPTHPAGIEQPISFPPNWPLHKSGATFSFSESPNGPETAFSTASSQRGLSKSPDGSTSSPTSYARAVSGPPVPASRATRGSSYDTCAYRDAFPVPTPFKAQSQSRLQTEGSGTIPCPQSKEAPGLQFAFDSDISHTCFKHSGSYCRVCDSKPFSTVPSVFPDTAARRTQQRSQSTPIPIPGARDRSPLSGSESRRGRSTSPIGSLVTEPVSSTDNDGFTVVGPGKHKRRRLREQQLRQKRVTFPTGGTFKQLPTGGRKANCPTPKSKKIFSPGKKENLKPFSPRPTARKIFLQPRSTTTLTARTLATSAITQTKVARQLRNLNRPSGDCFCATPLSRQDPQRLLNWSFYLLSAVIILHNLPVATGTTVNLPKGYYFSGTDKVFSWGNASTVQDAMNDVKIPSLPFRANYDNLSATDYVALTPKSLEPPDYAALHPAALVNTWITRTMGGIANLDPLLETEFIQPKYINTSISPFNLVEPGNSTEWGDYIFQLCLKLGYFDNCTVQWSNTSHSHLYRGFMENKTLLFSHENSITERTLQEAQYSLRKEWFPNSTIPLNNIQALIDLANWNVWIKLLRNFHNDRLAAESYYYDEKLSIYAFCKDKCVLKYCSPTKDTIANSSPDMNCGIAFKACYQNCALTPFMQNDDWEIITPIDFGFDDPEFLHIHQAYSPQNDSYVLPPGPLIHTPENEQNLSRIIDYDLALMQEQREKEIIQLNPNATNLFGNLSSFIDFTKTNHTEARLTKIRTPAYPEKVKALQRNTSLTMEQKDNLLNQLHSSLDREKRDLSQFLRPKPENISIDEMNRSILGYDCSLPSSIQSVQIPSKLNDCHQQHEPPVVQLNQSFILLQEASSQPITVVHCRMKTSVIPTGCGMHSHQWIMHPWVEIERDEKLSPEACQTYWDTQQYVDTNNHVHQLRRNAVNRIVFTDVGNVSPKQNGYCTPGTIRRGHDIWTNIVQSRHSTLILEEIPAHIDQDRNVRLDTGIQLRCPSSMRRCLGSSGTYIWDLPSPDQSCPLYQTRVTSGTVSMNNKGQKIFISNDGTMIRLVMKDSIYRCGGLVHKTGYNNLFLTEDQENKFFTRSLPFSEYSVITYTNQQDGFLYGYLTDQIKEEFEKVSVQNCERHNAFQNIDYSSLIAEQSIPIEGSTAHIGAGWFVTSAGDSYYKYQCRPIVAFAKSSKECFSSLPVQLSEKDERIYRRNLGYNESRQLDLFLAPQSHLLTEIGIQQVCNPRLPTKYLGVYGQWITLTAGEPEVAKVPETLQLTPSEIQQNPFKNLDFQKGGIYDPTNAILMERIRAAGRTILDGLQYLGNSVHQGTNIRPPRQLFEELHQSFSDRLVSLNVFTRFWNSIVSAWQAWGDFCSGLVGAYFALYLLLTITEWILRCNGIAFSWAQLRHRLCLHFQHRKRRRQQSSFPNVNPTPLEPDPESSPPVRRSYGVVAPQDRPIIRATTRAELHAPPPTRSRPLSDVSEEHETSAKHNPDLPGLNPSATLSGTSGTLPSDPTLLPMPSLSRLQLNTSDSLEQDELPANSDHLPLMSGGSTKFWDQQTIYQPQDPAKLKPEFLQLRVLDLSPLVRNRLHTIPSGPERRKLLGYKEVLLEYQRSLSKPDPQVNHARIAAKLIEIEDFLRVPTTFTPRTRPKLQRQLAVEDAPVKTVPTPEDLLCQTKRLRRVGSDGHPPLGDDITLSAASFPEPPAPEDAASEASISSSHRGQ